MIEDKQPMKQVTRKERDRFARIRDIALSNMKVNEEGLIVIKELNLKSRRKKTDIENIKAIVRNREGYMAKKKAELIAYNKAKEAEWEEMREREEAGSRVAVQFLTDIFDSLGLKVSFKACGCCDSPWLQIEKDGEMLFDVENANIDMFKETE